MNLDIYFMRRAIQLAKKGFGKTSPNPIVGAVVVKNGEIIGEGFHQKAGTPHAEVNALNDAGKNAENATIYVTLEPCSTTGRTPPCTEAIISAKIAKVVIGSLDPNPKHAGNAIKILEKHGIDVKIDVEKEKCLKLNKSFFHWIQTKQPYVILKMAMTLDGKIATHTGNSQWITGKDARKYVQKLRKWADAIMVGGETVRQDKPSLTVRNSQNKPLKNWKQPLRIVASNSMTQKDVENLISKGTPPMIIQASTKDQWKKQMQSLGENNITSILVEGGSELAASLLSANVINEIAFFIAPKILIGKNAIPVVGGNSPDFLASAIDINNLKIKKIGSDYLFIGNITNFTK